MPHRRCLLVLVTGLTVLIATFAVLMAFHSLFSALGDVVAARVLFGFAMTCLVLLVVDVLLLVGVLGMRAIQDHQSDEGERPGGSGDDAGN